MSTSNPRTAVRRGRTPFIAFILALALLASGGVSTYADNKSGVSTTGTPSACYDDDLKKVITDCIAANQASAPAGNSGPFTRGYDSIVVLGAQCYSGGFSSLTSIGDNVVVGSAANEKKVSKNSGPANDASAHRMKWATKLIEEIKRKPERKMKETLDAVKACNPDPTAMTPDPATSTGGADVVMGDPSGTSTKSYHAVLFAGIAESATGAYPARFRRAAHMAALDGMESALKDKLNVPAGNIAKMFGGTYDDLKNLIKAAWDKMNDNEQFILFVGDHGARCCESDASAVTPGTGGNSHETVIPTEPYMVEPEVVDPCIGVNTTMVTGVGDVLINGVTIGTITPSTGDMLYEFQFSPSALQPAGGANLIEVLIPVGQIQFHSIVMSTGPVVGDSEVNDPATCDNPLQVFPFDQDFEGTDFNDSNVPPFDWMQDEFDNPGPHGDWLFRNQPTPSAGTGPPADVTTGVPGEGFYAYVEDSGNHSAVNLFTPCFDLSSVSSTTLFFQVHSNDATFPAGENFLHIDAIVFPGALVLADVVPPIGHIGPDWSQQIVDLSAFDGAQLRLRFRVDSTNSGLNTFSHDIAIDEVLVTSYVPGAGQPPRPGLAFMDINDSVEANGFPTTSGLPGPYFGSAQAGGNMTFTFESQPNTPIILFTGPLNPGVQNFGPDIGILDIDNPSIIIDGSQPGFVNLLFNTGPNGVQAMTFIVPAPLAGAAIPFQSLLFAGALGVSLTNTVELGIVP